MNLVIIIDNKLRFQSEFIRDNKFNEHRGLKDATVQQWYDWGFREYVVPLPLPTQKLGDFYLDIVTDTITYYVLDKSQLEIDTEISNRKTQLISQFEADTDNLIRSVIGERGNEYEIAEQEAISFKAAGYPNVNVPQSISSDAIANGYSNIIACDNILVMSTNWRALQVALRSNRLLLKAQAKNAISLVELQAVETSWNDFMTYIKTQIIV